MCKYEAMGRANVKDFAERLITEFEGMAARETLLIGSNVTQEDLLMQIIGTIVKVENEK